MMIDVMIDVITDVTTLVAGMKLFVIYHGYGYLWRFGFCLGKNIY